MAKCDPGGVAVESAEKLRGRRAAPHYAINAPLRARSGAAVEQDVEDVEGFKAVGGVGVWGRDVW